MSTITKTKSIRYIIAAILIFSMLLAGGVTAIFALSDNVKNGKAPSFAKGDTSNVEKTLGDDVTLNYGSGMVYMVGRKKYYDMTNTGTIGAERGDISTVGSLAKDVAGMTHLKYTIPQGELVRDAFQVSTGGGISFYPEPDGDIVGIDMSLYVTRFYGKLPGTTTFKIGCNYNSALLKDANGSYTDYAIWITITVVENEKYQPLAAPRVGNISNRTFEMPNAGGSVTLAQLVGNENVDNYEIMGVGRGNYSFDNQAYYGVVTIGHFGVSTAPGNVGERTGNKSISILGTTNRSDYTPYTEIEVIVRSNQGIISVIPAVIYESAHSSVGKIALQQTQARDRTWIASSNKIIFDAKNLFLHYGTNAADPRPNKYVWMNGVTYNSPNSLYPTNNTYPGNGSAGGGFIDNIEFINVAPMTTPVSFSAFTKNWLPNSAGGHDSDYSFYTTEAFFVNAPNWDNYAPRPKRFTSDIQGTTILASGAGGTYINTTNYPTIRLDEDKIFNISAEDFATVPVGRTMEITRIHTHSTLLYAALSKNENNKGSIIVSPGENYFNGPLYENKTHLTLEVTSNNAAGTDPLSSYITLYFTLKDTVIGNQNPILSRNQLAVN